MQTVKGWCSTEAWSCSEVKGHPLADHVPSAGGQGLHPVMLPAALPQTKEVLLTSYSHGDADLLGWSSHQCPVLSSRS